MQTFDGWIEVEASATGLGIFTVTGSWDMTRMDGAVVRPLSSDFVLFHAGASAILVNPSPRIANATLNGQPVTISARSRLVTTLTGVVRVQSSEPLAAVERISAPGKLSLGPAVPAADAQATLVFPYAVIGGGYNSILSIANLAALAQDVTVTFGSLTGTVHMEGNSATRVSIGELLQIPAGTKAAGLVRLSEQPRPFTGGGPSWVAVLDIENETGLVTTAARTAATSLVFPHVAHGNGLFTGLALASGNNAATITIEVYNAAGNTPKTATVRLDPNQQLAKLISEWVPGVDVQMGGYIKVRSDQPIWALEIYGSGEVMASGPPL